MTSTFAWNRRVNKQRKNKVLRDPEAALCISVAKYTTDSPLWECCVYWSDDPHNDVACQTFGSQARADIYAARYQRLAAKFRVPTLRFHCGVRVPDSTK